MPGFGAVILAAGLSSRMVENKILLPWRDAQPMVRHVAGKYLRCGVEPVIVVTGRDAAQVQARLADLPLQCVNNPDYAAGEILPSLKVGLRALPKQVAAVFIQPADMPCVPPAVIRRLRAVHQPGWNAAPRHRGQRGHPVLLDREFWPAMLALPPDAMPRAVLRAGRERLRLLDTDDVGVVLDIDTREMYEQVLQRGCGDGGGGG